MVFITSTHHVTVILCLHVLQIVGMPYLHETLGSVIEQIYEEQKSVELDPSRLGSIRKWVDNHISL